MTDSFVLFFFFGALSPLFHLPFPLCINLCTSYASPLISPRSVRTSIAPCLEGRERRAAWNPLASWGISVLRWEPYWLPSFIIIPPPLPPSGSCTNHALFLSLSPAFYPVFLCFCLIPQCVCFFKSLYHIYVPNSTSNWVTQFVLFFFFISCMSYWHTYQLHDVLPHPIQEMVWLTPSLPLVNTCIYILYTLTSTCCLRVRMLL